MLTFTKKTTGSEVVSEFKDYIAGQTVVITGASANSLGAQTAIELARGPSPPAHLILLARSASKVQPVIDQIKNESAANATFVSISLDDPDSVRKAAKQVSQILGYKGKIDYLLNYAGIMATPYTLTKEGIESQFATNHIGHFLLTLHLMPLIKRAGSGARVINVASDGYKLCPAQPDDYNFDDGKTYHPFAGYGQSKTANILFTKGLAKRGVTSFAIHPGVIMSTSLAQSMDYSLFAEVNDLALARTGRGFEVGSPVAVEQGVATALRAALDPSLASQSGSYLADCEVEEVYEFAKDEKVVDRLWEVSEGLVGEKFVI